MSFYESDLLRRQLPSESLAFFRPQHAVNSGWSFIRTGVTICGDTLCDQEIDAASIVSHELAHLWSSGAPINWEDWLNESFAEYASALFIERIFGEAAYKKKVADLWQTNREKFRGEPIRPVAGEARPDSVHTKGALVLDELRDAFGLASVHRVIRAFDGLQDKSTENLLAQVRAEEMPTVAEFIEKRICAAI
jgi:aminopeptidase N